MRGVVVTFVIGIRWSTAAAPDPAPSALRLLLDDGTGRAWCVDELEDRHGRGVAPSGAELQDARVTAGTVACSRTDVLEQTVHDLAVL
jgi:hypothetical protein